MLQTGTVNIVSEKGLEISQVQDWINQKIKDSEVIEIKLYNTELIFDGTLNTFLGDIDVLSAEGIDKDELNKLFKSHPYCIHQFVLKHLKPARSDIAMTEKTSLYDISEYPHHIIDDTELNQLIANFPKKIGDKLSKESCGYIGSESRKSENAMAYRV